MNRGEASAGRSRLAMSSTCSCPPKHLNCMTAKEWIVSQLGVWRFTFESRDIRDKSVHPATFPISLCKRVIQLFCHEGELVLDPFLGSGTTLVAARDLKRNAVGFDLQERYVRLAEERLNLEPPRTESQQLAIADDAWNIPSYLEPERVSLLWTSPPYANLLNRQRKNKSRRERANDQLGKVEQYSQDPARSGHLASRQVYAPDGEDFCPVAAAVEAGRALRDQRSGHVVGEPAHYDPRRPD